MEPQKFNKLLHKTKSDKRALIPIYQEFYAKIVLHLRTRFRKCVCHEDIAQEVFATLLNMEHKEYINAPQQWLFSIANNKAVDFIKKHQKEIPLTTDTGASPACEISTQNIAIQLAFEHIDPVSQKILIMHFWEGFGHAEIAKALNMTCGNVRQKASRAYKILKRFS